MKPVHQSLLVEENVAPRLCTGRGGEKKPRELIIYVFHTALIFPLPSKIFEESAGFYLEIWWKAIRWISFCRDRWNNRKSVDLERLSWINFRTIGWIYNSIEIWNAKSDD